MLVVPSELVEVISVMPASRPNRRSRGVATGEAIVSGLAPGSAALTGWSGNPPSEGVRQAAACMPKRRKAGSRSPGSVVAMGLRMNGEEMLKVVAFGARWSAPGANGRCSVLVLGFRAELRDRSM